jgi:tetratricopeptide (TPR) repeat protein
MAKRWKKEEITYLKRYAKQRTLEELTARYQIEAEMVQAKLSELGLKTSDGMGKVDLSDDPIVKLFERGAKAVHTGKYAEARPLLERVVAESDLSEVMHRAEQYLAVCERYGEKPGTTGGDAYLEAVLIYNEGDLDGAEDLCKRAGRMEKDDRFAYLGAAVAASREDFELAEARLSKAIELNDRNRIQAREDLDFGAMREQPEFEELFV